MLDSNSKQLNKYESVGGWLLLLCFALTIGTPLTTIYNLTTSYNASSPYFGQFPGLKNLFYIDSFLSVLLIAFSIKAGIALWRKKTGAVKEAKSYLLFLLGYSVVAVFLPFISGMPFETNVGMIPELVYGVLRTLLFVGIWYWYLTVSERVKATYKSYVISEEPVNLPIKSENHQPTIKMK